MIITALKVKLLSNLNSLWDSLSVFLPKLFLVLFILWLGFKIAKWTSKFITIALQKVGFDEMSYKMGVAELLASMGLSPKLSEMIAKLVYFCILLVFFVTAADILEVQSLSDGIQSVIKFIPNVIAALGIFFVTAIAANFIKGIITSATDNMGIEFGGLLAQLIYFGILFIGIILSLGQMKIETTFLTNVVLIILVGTSAAIAIALGLGSRDIAKNLISGLYLKESLEEGNTVKVGEFSGTLLQVGSVSFDLQTQDGQKVSLPNSRLIEIEIISADT